MPTGAVKVSAVGSKLLLIVVEVPSDVVEELEVAVAVTASVCEPGIQRTATNDDVAPSGIVIADGTGNVAGILLVSCTIVPPAGAGSPMFTRTAAG